MFSAKGDHSVVEFDEVHWFTSLQQIMSCAFSRLSEFILHLWAETVPSPVPKDEGRVRVGLGFKFFLLFNMSWRKSDDTSACNIWSF